MVLATISVLDDAQLVVTGTIGGDEYAIAWFGGTMFEVLTATDRAGYVFEIAENFALSDENGRPPDRETAREHAQEWLDRENQERTTSD